MNHTLYFDGSCEPTNPGGVSSGGWALFSGPSLVRSESLYICEGVGSTNNVAEYGALLAGITTVKSMMRDGDSLLIRGDSALVVNQVAMKWKCKADHLRKLRDRCISLLYGLSWKIEWIPREQNTIADELSKSAYTTRTGELYPERRRVHPHPRRRRSQIKDHQQ